MVFQDVELWLGQTVANKVRHGSESYPSRQLTGFGATAVCLLIAQF